MLYKVLDADGTPCHGGTGRWPLPKGSKPGKWLTVEGTIMPCRNGLHVCEPADLIHWIGPAIFEVETSGGQIRHEHKTVAARARLIRRVDTWNDCTARLFAVDCATRALNREKKAGRTPDPRSWAALKVARRFANGQADHNELAAARAAAEAADWAAAEAAAEAAARAAERKWQTKRLHEYLTGARG